MRFEVSIFVSVWAFVLLYSIWPTEVYETGLLFSLITALFPWIWPLFHYFVLYLS